MMNTKYFYYISKTKVDMLLSQFRHSKLAVPKITPKIDVVGIGIEAEIGSQARENLVKDTLSLLRLMTRRKLIRDLARNSAFDTRSFWHDEGRWFNGLYLFSAEVELATYFLWKAYQDAIILLVGSPLNILGEKIVRDGVRLPGTGGVCNEVHRFVDKIIGPDEMVLAADNRYKGHPYFTRRKLPGATYEMANDAEFAETFEFLRPPPRALSLGVLCMKYLVNLPKSEIDTVFKLFHRYDLEHPKDLLDWGLVLSSVSKQGIINRMRLERTRTVFVGSPIYTAIL
ncbi:MAG: hypothetical protein P8186_25245 [Anaerolineae bacterium]